LEVEEQYVKVSFVDQLQYLKKRKKQKTQHQHWLLVAPVVADARLDPPPPSLAAG
jgi:hypothetical protein